MKRLAFSMAFLFCADAAQAQMTGTLMTRQPAQTDVDDKHAARKMNRGFTNCMVDRSPQRIKVYLALPVGGDAATRMVKRLFDREGDACMGMGQMTVPQNLLRGGLYEALYLKEYSGKALPDFKIVQTIDYLAPYQDGISDQGKQAVAMVQFADCVVRARGNDARSLMFLIPGSSSESRTFVDLTPSFGGCLPKDAQFEFSKSVLRAALAEALYRLTESSVATASN